MDNKKQSFKIVISRKSNGEICEFVLASNFTYEMALDFARNHFPFSDCDVLAVCPVDPSVPRLAAYIVTFEDRTILCFVRIVLLLKMVLKLLMLLLAILRMIIIMVM